MVEESGDVSVCPLAMNAANQPYSTMTCVAP